MSKVKLYQKDYKGFESLSELNRDVSEAFDPNFNPAIEQLPPEFEGTVRVIIEYIDWDKEP